ncbi:PREDICTED: protein FAM8A1-like [Priapulus caudatus]|uniref:Protein FAM8A1-like n=1 Tax=Priapulus caudatus TaxID=37621 RepID=A0ABM1ESI8_PRICU|nr:PREDICTED: protein FAM8A1-like [Priapulus caudatus]
MTNEQTSSVQFTQWFRGRQETVDYKSANDYAVAVRQWMWQCHIWKFYTMFPFGMPPSPPQGLASNVGLYEETRDSHGNVVQQHYQGLPLAGLLLPFPLGVGQPHAPGLRAEAAYTATTSAAAQRPGRQYRIPHVWKRFCAETIDFLILFVLKVILTLIAAEEFDLIQLTEYEWADLTDSDNFETALRFTQDLMILELIYRLSCLVYETIFLQRGLTSSGGSTPGKRMLGLKVVLCREIQELPDGRVIVVPADDLGFGWALLRSLVKNFSIAFMFPITLTMCLFQHNRAVYDLIANSVVVEDLVN